MMRTPLLRQAANERGSALIEAAMVTPILLLIMVGIFEVGRAYQHWQVLTNAAREGARVAVLPGSDTDTVTAVVQKYMTDGQLGYAADAKVAVAPSVAVVNGRPIGMSQVTVDYPFKFIVLQPVARLINRETTTGEAITIRATSQMRTESQ